MQRCEDDPDPVFAGVVGQFPDHVTQRGENVRYIDVPAVGPE